MSAPEEPFQVVGFYSQPYTEIVHPDRIWRVSKYFLRRWGPYLSPARFWAVVASRQLAYWNDKCRWFTVYDKRFAQEAQLSTIHFRRLKTEINKADQAISLFLSQQEKGEQERYHVVNGQTKPKPTTYNIRLDDPLTPADGLHLASWLQQNTARQASAVAALLREARSLPRKTLLAPQLTPYLADSPAEFKPLFVRDIVSRVFGSSIAQNEAVEEEADLLHTYLTGTDYYGKEYFRRNWIKVLKPGPAYLLTYLRSFCFYDERTGELRNEVTFTRPELADNLGVTTKTVVNWLKKLETAVPQQALNGFLTQLAQTRLSSNDVQYTYRVEMIEPLTQSDLPIYREFLVNLDTADPQETPDGKNDSHDPSTTPAPQGKNDSHELRANGKNDNHEKGGQGKFEDHEPSLMEKMMTGEGNIEHASGKKRFPFKYYKILFQTVGEEEKLLDADWSSSWQLENDIALRPFAEVISGGSFEKLFDLFGVDRSGPTRANMLAGRLDIGQMVAWYLYAASQKGLSKPPLHLTIARILSGALPPQSFVALANLSWELWRCFANLLILHPAARDAFRDAPLFDEWLTVYGRYSSERLPFGVGEDLMRLIGRQLADNNGNSASEDEPTRKNREDCFLPGKEEQLLWQSILNQLELSMTKATFNSWLRGSVLVEAHRTRVNGKFPEWVVEVANEQAVEWLSNRLNDRIIAPIASSIFGNKVVIRYKPSHVSHSDY